jgi:peptidyl-prolyl cis-trans isomerase C
MSIKNLAAIAVLLGIVLAAGCEKKPAEAGKVLATVNSETITEKDYEDYRRLRESQLGPIGDKASEKKLVLDELVNRTLLAQRATEQKLDQEPEVALVLKRVRQDILVNALERKALTDRPITDDDLKKRYQEEVEKTHKTEYRARHILVKTEDEAKDVIRQLQGGANFANLAKKLSVDKESARNGGDLDWINQGMPIVPEFFEALGKLKKGEMTSTPVKTEYGFHVIKVEDTRPLKLPTFEELMADRRAKTNLYRRMQQETIANLVKDLRANAKIKIEE